MDEQHRQDLARILENRRRRGVRRGTPDLSSPRSRSPRHSSPQQQPAASSVGRAIATAVPPAARPQRRTPPREPLRHAAASEDVEDSSRHSAQMAAQLLRQQQSLQQGQAEQQRQLEALQAEMRSGLTQVAQVLASAVTTQSSPSYGLTENRRAHFVAHTEGLTDRLNSLQRSLGRGEPSGQPAPLHFSKLRISREAAVDALPTQMPKSVPIPVIFEEGRGMVQNPRALTFPSREEKEAAEYRDAVARAPREPLPLPASIQPFSTSSIDIASSVTILRSGDWFLKWNAKGNHVSPKYLWLDTEKNILVWAKSRGASSLLSGYVRIEEILDVSTDQMHDVGADDVPRIYYVLVLTCKHRRVQLGTEKREKLNLWYDAISNLSLFYRVRGTQSHAYDQATE